MTLHPSTFEYHQPTEAQKEKMSICRQAMAECAQVLEQQVPDGPDKTYLMRKLREVGMWANVAITRLPDGTPRADQTWDLPPTLNPWDVVSSKD